MDVWNVNVVALQSVRISQFWRIYKARIFLKLLRNPRIDSKESISPDGPVRQPYSCSLPSLHRLIKNSRTVNGTRCPCQFSTLFCFSLFFLSSTNSFPGARNALRDTKPCTFRDYKSYNSIVNSCKLTCKKQQQVIATVHIFETQMKD